MKPLLGIAAACLVAILSLESARDSASAAPPELWLGAFGHPPTAYNLTPPVTVTRPDGTTRTQMPGYAPLDPYENVTVREVVRISAAARKLRIRFTNEFGSKALKIGAAHVALAGEDGTIIPGSDHVVTFDGQGAVTIPQGAPMLGDPIDWTLPAFAKLAVSVYYPESTVPPAHTLYTLDGYQAGQPGDQTAAQTLSPAPAGERGLRRARACTAPGGCPLPAPSGVHVSEIDIVPTAARADPGDVRRFHHRGRGLDPGRFPWLARCAGRAAAGRSRYPRLDGGQCRHRLQPAVA